MTRKRNQKSSRGRKQKKLGTHIVLKYLSQRTEPANTKAIAETLGRIGKEGRQETFAVLEELRDQGKVKQLSKHRWALPQAIHVHTGRVIGHIDGHGYVLSDETKEKIFLRSHDMNEVLHNDLVEIQIAGRDRRGKLFGQIVNVVERGNDCIVGRYFNENGVNFVVPDDQRIGQDVFILPEHTMNAETGYVVSVKITKHPTKHFQPVGEIVEVLGEYLAPGMEIEIALRKHQLPHTWNESVEQEVRRFRSEVTDADTGARKDIRELPLVTIDGEDARDFDDAVYCQALDNGNTRLLVAIADVSHYVKEGSAIDQEAWQRGNSVYFPNNVIPMLPEVLSNGLCSLNPKVNRLCFVCDMQMDESGEIAEYDFYEALMYSQARLTYTQVAKLIDGDAQGCDINEDLQANVLDLYALSKKLRSKRNEHGTIDFDVPEPVILFDENRKIESVVARERNEAHRLIEECMLAANICASLCLDDSELIGIYRVHESPEADKINDVREFLRQFKLLLNGGDQPEPKFYAQVMAQVDDPLTLKIVQTALLRSMKQARYSEENLGHFALNFDSYSHFTSPIRRYSDLVVHRQIKRLLQDQNAQDDEQMLTRVSQTAEQTSMTERRADSATRDVIQWLKCEYMSHRVGEKMWGTVTSVTDFGLFVELNDLYIDGLVHITSLGDDYYRFDETRRLLKGEHSNTIYKTGQQLEVQVSRVDMEQGRIDFELIDVIKLKHSSNSKGKFANKKPSKKGVAKSKASKTKTKGKRRR